MQQGYKVYGMKKLFFLLLTMVILIAPVMAASHLTSSNGLTASGPYNILLSLGLEYLVPIGWAYLIYNFIAIGLLYLAMSVASQRNMRFFAVIIPMLAGIFAFFGWYNNYNSTVPVWPLVIATSLIGAGIYLKDTNREKWGSGGGGTTIINFVFYIILLQACVGLVNNSGIWGNNNAPTPDQYQNVDLQAQIGGINNTGGWLGVAGSVLTTLTVVGYQACQMIFSILATVAVFSLVLIFVFPFLATSTLAIAVLAVTQIVIWLLYSWMFFLMTYKPPVIDQLGVG
jgi:hypothetical protein